MIDLDAVADELSWIRPEPVYVGGVVVPLFLDDFGRSQARPTEDVDCIVPQILTREAWWDLERQLRQRRWSPDPTGPICRYRSPNGAVVDLMPTDPGILGFGGAWYARVVAQARPLELAGGKTILVPPPSLLFACKLEAFRDRGMDDPWMSRDLEDIAAMLDGCRELLSDLRAQEADVQGFIAQQLRAVGTSRTASEALRAQLPRGGDRERQLQRIEQLLRQLTRSG